MSILNEPDIGYGKVLTSVAAGLSELTVPDFGDEVITWYSLTYKS